jgi:hypothetical protein
MDRQSTLEEQHKHYTDLVRWSQFDEAASYLKPSERSQFVRQMPEFEEVRFTDWKAEPWEFEDPETLDFLFFSRERPEFERRTICARPSPCSKRRASILLSADSKNAEPPSARSCAITVPGRPFRWFSFSARRPSEDLSSPRKLEPTPYFPRHWLETRSSIPPSDFFRAGSNAPDPVWRCICPYNSRRI